ADAADPASAAASCRSAMPQSWPLRYRIRPQTPQTTKISGREQQRAVDQAEVAVRLRVVAQSPFGERVVLLGQQAGRAGAADHLVEQVRGVGPTAGAQVRLDQPRAADVEPAFAPW